MTFELHPNLQSKIFVKDLPLSTLLLEDNSHYPWLYLVPRRPNISRTIDLTPKDQLQLLTEIDLVQNLLWTEFQPTQINVAAIGNKTPQLHIHLIARFTTDPAWPNTVWDHPACTLYTPDEREETLERLVGNNP